MAEESFDVIVIGAGPGGYVCAIRCAQLGLKTALIEKSKTLGGTCLNVGCIPSKALLRSSEFYHQTLHAAASHGIKTGKTSLDLPAMMKKKDEVVGTLVKGVKTLVSKKGVTVFHGNAAFADASSVEIEADGKKQTVSGKNIVIATGSSPVELPFLKFDGKTVVNSDHAIAFDQVPKKLAVVGAGAIGLELGSVWSRLGSEVTVVEFLPRVAATFDADISKLLERLLKKQGLSFELGTKVTGMKKDKKTTLLTAEKDGKELTIPADIILVAVGRAPNTEGLNPKAAGVETDEKGRVRTIGGFRTTAKGVFAIGDVIAGPMLAHKAEEEGVALAELLAGKAGHVNYDVIPNVIYTEPEVASVGITESEAKERNIETRVGKFPFAANGRALANDAPDGMVKVIADAETDRLLGVQILGQNASELIAAAVSHMEYGGSAEDLARTIHAHPTLSEALKEAALAVDKRAIHSL